MQECRTDGGGRGRASARLRTAHGMSLRRAYQQVPSLMSLCATVSGPTETRMQRCWSPEVTSATTTKLLPSSPALRNRPPTMDSPSPVYDRVIMLV